MAGRAAHLPPTGVVQAPMAGGPSTPELAVAVSTAGGLGFLAGGYLRPGALADELARVRRLSPSPISVGVGLFTPVAGPAALAEVEAFAARLEPFAARAGVAPGTARFDDDSFAAKIELVEQTRPAVVSFAFGCPEPAVVQRLQRAGCAVWITVEHPDEAAAAVAAGADAVIAQGAEAGGHRGGFSDDRTPLPIDDLLRELSALMIPAVAAGGLATAADAARVRALGAHAVQVGTAFLLAPEAGTSPVHRDALTGQTPTELTRAYSGRRGRGIANAWSRAIGDDAPAAYPEVHHLTTPIRAAGRAAGDPDLVNLWAGTEYPRTVARPAAETVRELARRR